MDPTFPRFLINEFIAPDSFTGRNCGTPIHVGLRFTSYRVIRYAGDAMDLRVDNEEVYGPIELTLIQITAYGKVFDDLDSGHTGTIQVVGLDVSRIVERLKDLQAREQLTLESPLALPRL